MKRISKIITISLSTILAITLLYSYLCFIFLPKNISDSGGENYYRGKCFTAEPIKNSLDIIAFGHSSVYSAFSPVTLYNEYGYTSFSAGVALQSIDKINEQLEQAIKTQKPKIALLDVDCLYLPSLKNSGFINIAAPFLYHYRWKTLKLKDFYKIPGKIDAPDLSKGFVVSKKICQVNPKNYMGNENATPKKLTKKNKKHLDRFVRTCRKNNIELVFIDFPSTVSWDYSKHNYISKYANSQNLAFIDMNIPSSDYTVNFNHDFRDDGNHLNIYGAEKATKFLGKYVNEKYGASLADKREDQQFAYWDKAVQYFNTQLRNQ